MVLQIASCRQSLEILAIFFMYILIVVIDD